MSEAEHGRAYRTLDGMRGVAALLVVTRHVDGFFAWGLFPKSFLAVDLFFLLSGFVVAYAYEARLLAGQSLWSFMRTRLIRLYPLYILGLGVGVAARIATAGATDTALDPLALVESAGVAMLMLPAVPPLPLGGSVLDGPTWTLAPELVVNFAYAATVRRLGTKALWAIVALGAVGLVVCEYAYGSLDEGWSASAFPLLVSRIVFSFFLGVALFRLKAPRGRHPLAAWACLALLAGVLMLVPPKGLSHLYELGAIIGVFPALVAVAVRCEPGRLGAKLFGFLGLVSYAVYVLHEPVGVLAGLAARQFGWSGEATPLTAALFLAGVVALGALADQLYDTPVRRALTRLSRSPRDPQGAVIRPDRRWRIRRAPG